MPKKKSAVLITVCTLLFTLFNSSDSANIAWADGKDTVPIILTKGMPDGFVAGPMTEYIIPNRELGKKPKVFTTDGNRFWIGIENILAEVKPCPAPNDAPIGKYATCIVNRKTFPGKVAFIQPVGDRLLVGVSQIKSGTDTVFTLSKKDLRELNALPVEVQRKGNTTSPRFEKGFTGNTFLYITGRSAKCLIRVPLQNPERFEQLANTSGAFDLRVQDAAFAAGKVWVLPSHSNPSDKVTLHEVDPATFKITDTHEINGFSSEFKPYSIKGIGEMLYIWKETQIYAVNAKTAHISGELENKQKPGDFAMLDGQLYFGGKFGMQTADPVSLKLKKLIKCNYGDDPFVLVYQ